MGGASFCARISARAPSAPRSRHHVSATQSGYECASAASCQVESGSASTHGPALVREPSQHGVRERHRTLEPRAAHELDGLVHRGVARHAVEEGELEGAEPQGCAHGRVETPQRATADRLDRMVERAGPLHGAVRELPGKRPVAVVEPGRRGPQRAIGVRLVLEHPPDHVERRGARGRDRGRHQRRPRSQAAASMRLPPSG